MNLPHSRSDSGSADQDDARFVSAVAADERARKIRITAGRDIVVVAEVVQSHSEARVCFRDAVRRLPARDRARLVDEVFGLSEIEPGMRVEAVLPTRECDVLSHLLLHCTDAHAHAAGVSCVVQATVVSCAVTSERR